MEIRKLIPEDKDDFETVERLKAISFDELKPIVSELLTWLQDLHWQIARSIAEILIPFVDRLIPDFIEIFKTNDSEWKYNILILFGYTTNDPIFIEEIRRISFNPTQDEISEEVDIEARSILSKLEKP
jgi:hypothetical protein